VKTLMHPMIACTPAMEKDLSVGVTLDIPADVTSTYASIYVDSDVPSDPELSTEAGATPVEVYKEDAPAARYLLTQSAGKGYAVEVDWQRVKGCFSGVKYAPYVFDGGNEAFVDIQRLMVPAIACTPAMMRDLQFGARFEVKASSSFTSTDLLVLSPKAKLNVVPLK
jgi:hypothetical protein